MLRLSSLFLLLLIGALPGCEMLGPDEGEVSARSIGDGLFITNSTQARVYYFIVGRETATLIDWGPHLDVERSVTPGKTAWLDREDDVMGSEDEKEAFVHWWHAVERDGERVPGEVHTFVIRL